MDIPGYDFGSHKVARSPVSLDDLGALERAAGLEDEDRRALRRAGELLSSRAEEMVDSWRARIGANPELVRLFFGPDGKPDEHYKAAVQQRFVQWVRDTFNRPRDQAWLDYQEEIALRHTPAKKNRTDAAQTPPLVPLRYLVAFTAVVADLRPFLDGKGLSADELRKLDRAWQKAVAVQVALWCRPYAREGLW